MFVQAFFLQILQIRSLKSWILNKFLGIFVCENLLTREFKRGMPPLYKPRSLCKFNFLLLKYENMDYKQKKSLVLINWSNYYNHPTYLNKSKIWKKLKMSDKFPT